MKIIEKLNTEEVKALLAEFQADHDFSSIEDVLQKLCVFRVQIYVRDFDDILINSSTELRELQQSEYPGLGTVVRSISIEASFLNRIHHNRGLSGVIVEKYRQEFLSGSSKPIQFFIVDRTDYPEMNKNGLFYVRDGMHHLVAYGLATQMNEKAFPIVGFYGSSRESV